MMPSATRRRVLAALPLLAACALGGRAVSVRAADIEPIRIGVCGPFTGGSSPMGISMREGIRIAASQINAAGGLLDRPIQLIERDDEARNERGAQIAQELIQREGIVAALGIVNTGVALASQRHYQLARIPMITSVATGTLITRQFLPPEFADNYIFRVSANDSVQAQVIVDEAVTRRGLQRLAIFHDATNYGVLGSEDLIEALRRSRISPVAVERFQLRQADMTAPLQHARDAGAEAVLTYGIGPELAQIANTLARLNWRVPIIGSWTLAMSNFIDNAGPNAEGARMPQTFIPDPATPAARNFLDAWQRATGTQRIPVPPAAAQGYDSALLLAAAIRQANSLEGDRIRAALEDLREPVRGVIMTYARPYLRDQHETLTSPHQIHVGEVRNGQVVFAYEADRQRAMWP
ncbi:MULTISPECIES: ABC transporter substrate-binding protein [Thauera]|uniref:Amino acid ABC transporter substrate-binding protein n=1 Tax=Thauera humireducens TaxID=1134435 RepID=A0A140ID91_9RHOO|nr:MULTISPECIES: ABC transporter substrate-binding protein [Thauera]AMO35716.1 amino acid ABC transporter substrate-binding protein [Thauera humireducens]CAH1745191.1 Amino acid ABC transporter substrate-binding protein [Thauera humireducens]